MRIAAGAIQLAIDKANSDETLTELRNGDHELSYTWRDTACETKKGILATVDMWTNKNRDHRPIDAFIGSILLMLSIQCHVCYGALFEQWRAILTHDTLSIGIHT